MKKIAPSPLLVCLLAFACVSTVCRAQANINEGLETAIIFVDVVHGNDTTGTGTSTNPYKTIGKGVSVAVANNAAGIGTQVNIQPGTYRESITMSNAQRHVFAHDVSGRDEWNGVRRRRDGDDGLDRVFGQHEDLHQ
jgi:hypothetical protein